MEVNKQAPVVASSEIAIDAAPKTIWAVLIDVEGWPTWNSDVKVASMAGPLAEGTSFRWKASSLMISSVFGKWTLLAPWGGRAKLSASRPCTSTESNPPRTGRSCDQLNPGTDYSHASFPER